MANRHRNPFAAGAFILISVVLIFAVAIAIKGIGGLFDPMLRRTVSFSMSDDISGLQVGDELRIGGFKVGSVKKIEVVDMQSAKGEPRILVHYTIPKRYVLRQESRIRIGGGLLGTSWLNIESLGKGPALADDSIMQGLPNPLTQAFSQIGDKTLPAATALLEKVKEVVGNPTGDFSMSLANIKDLTGDFKAKFPGLLDRANAFILRVDNLVQNASSAVDDIKSAASDVKDVGASAKAIVVGNKAKLDGMITSLKETGDNLKNASSEIRRSPWRLLYKPGPGEAGNLNLFDAAREFAEGANDVNDAAQALRDAIASKQVNETHLKSLMKQLDESFTKFHGVEQKLWQSVKE